MTTAVRCLAVVTPVLSVTAVTPALAIHEAYSPDGGSHVWDNQTHDHFSVNDSKCDSHSAYGYWNSTDNRLENYSGCGTTVKKYNVYVTAVKACTNKPGWDSCSDWT